MDKNNNCNTKKFEHKNCMGLLVDKICRDTDCKYHKNFNEKNNGDIEIGISINPTNKKNKVNKIEQIEKLLSEWKAKEIVAKTNGLSGAEAEAMTMQYGINLALTIVKRPPNIQMHVDSKKVYGPTFTCMGCDTDYSVYELARDCCQ